MFSAVWLCKTLPRVISSDFYPCIFISGAGNLVAVYVDDILAVGPQQVCDEFATLLGNQFHIINQGPVSSFRGLNIKREGGMILINQIGSKEKMAKHFQLENCNPTSTPLDHSLPLLEAEPDSPRANQTLYRELTSSLNHLAITTRPIPSLKSRNSTKIQLLPILMLLAISSSMPFPQSTTQLNTAGSSTATESTVMLTQIADLSSVNGTVNGSPQRDTYS